jgi:hypothetical protein
MKNLFLICLCLLTEVAKAQIVNIPDANFKNALVNTNCVDTNNDGFGDADADTNNDGEIQFTEAEAVLRLHTNNKNIASLQGIHRFLNLLELHFVSNDVQNIDISFLPNLELLNCGYNPISSIDLSNNINLKVLGCYDTLVTNLDLSQNVNLEELFLRSNLLTQLDVTHNPNIIEIDCTYNQIVGLDTSQNPVLEFLICDFNEIIALDLSQNTQLIRLNATNNQLTSLNIKNGFNNIMTKMLVVENPNLECIQVDDVVFANNQICNGTSSLGWCKDITAFYSEDCALGIEDNELTTRISIYPNPVQNTLRIDSEISFDSVYIYSFQGQLIETNKRKEINVSDLSSGLYFVTFKKDGQSVTKKFIKS